MNMRAFPLLILLAILYFSTISVSGYVITTSRKWSLDESNRVCVTVDSPFTSEDHIKVGVKVKNSPVAPLKSLPLVEGDFNICSKVSLEEKIKSKNGTFIVEGHLEGVDVSYSREIYFSRIFKTFAQTDKALYKPGQTVQFRVLSIEGPFLKVSAEQYSEIYVENPSGVRIKQWLNVTNENGLIHLSFKLSEEPEQGEYTIYLQSQGKPKAARKFKVEEYVLPKFEVAIIPPKYILGSQKSFEVEVCAKYVFGEPVKGKLMLNTEFHILHGRWSSCQDASQLVKIYSPHSGCQKYTITSETFKHDVKSVDFSAIFTEDGTDIEINATKVSTEIHDQILNIQQINKPSLHKAGLPVQVKVKATSPDGSPAANILLEVCTIICATFRTNEKGILNVIIPPHIHNKVFVKANAHVPYSQSGTFRKMKPSSKEIEFDIYISPSNSSLVIYMEHDEVSCQSSSDDVSFNVPVWYSSNEQTSAQLTVQVVSRGQIQFSKSFKKDLTSSTILLNDDLLFESLREPEDKRISRGSFVIPISLPKTAAPEAKIIVWYTRDDGEVVADARSVDITKCTLANNVKLSWATQKARPGDNTKLSLKTEPSSICSLGVVDKSVDLLSGKTKSLSSASLLELTRNAEVKAQEKHINNEEFCKDWDFSYKGTDAIQDFENTMRIRRFRARHRFRYEYYTVGTDAFTAFNDADLVFITNGNTDFRKCDRNVVEIPTTRGTQNSPLNREIDRLDDGPNFPSFVPQPKEAASETVIEENEPEEELGISDEEIRVYFPETWLWSLQTINEDGLKTESLTLPDTVTEWVGRAVCVHRSEGVGFSNTASITTFRDFFVDLTLPPSVKRGEIFPVKISIFNYLKKSIPIRVSLQQTDEFEIVTDGKQLTSFSERSSCVLAEDKDVHSIRIKATAVGNVNLTVSAYFDENYIENCGPVTGEVKRDVIIKPIKVEVEGILKEETKSGYICAKESEDIRLAEPWVLAPPKDIVPDSVRGFVSVYGDLLGPTIENLGHLVRMPYGCGEQNMLNFAPNIYVMNYLESSKEGDPKIAEKAIKFMEKGYQRELTYRHKDGSYSAFGSRDDSGSTWLTAFVLKCFAQARQFIDIDKNDLVVSSKWLRNKQLENGCFESVGRIIHKDMKGGLSEGGDTTLLSSFVLISLIESGEETSSSVVKGALSCINASNGKNAYGLAVRSYALTLANSPEAKVNLDKLLKLKKELDSGIYWPTSDKQSSQSVAVETAAYALLALINLNDKFPGENYIVQAMKIVIWMNSQRNGQGGFVSTQDTILALQSLAEFESKNSVKSLDAHALIQTNDQQSEFRVNEHNKLLLQKTSISSFPATVNYDIGGPGCVLIQAVMRYNIPYPEPSEAFSLRVETDSLPGIACKKKKITACASYLLEDKESNMAILEVNLVSGYIPVKEDLKALVSSGLFKRYEVDGSLLTLYVDEFGPEETCATFAVLREVYVEDAKPGYVKVYDYYKPEYFITKKFELAEKECLED